VVDRWLYKSEDPSIIGKAPDENKRGGREMSSLGKESGGEGRKN